MTNKELFKKIRGVFKQPKKRWYFGKIIYGTPYFYPINFCNSIIKIRRLKRKSEGEIESLNQRYPWNIGKHQWANLPLARRSKDWIKKAFGSWWWIQIGWPISIRRQELGWKDKFESPRHEWSPAFYIFFFKWQICIFWHSPCGNREGLYWEMILWWLYYSDGDIKKAEETWGWIDTDTKQSTWNKNYLL